MTVDMLALIVLGLVVDIGENLADFLSKLLTLLAAIFAGGAAAQAGKRAKSAEAKAEQVVHQTKPNGGTSLRDVADRTEAAAKRVEAAIVSLHTRQTGELPPPPPPEG